MYHYAGNNPVKYVDPDGRVLETFWDIVFTCYDVGSAIYKSTQGDHSGWKDVGIDALSIVLPGVPAGISKLDEFVKFAEKGEKITSAINAITKRFDVVYGASANGALKNLADSLGSKLLSSYGSPYEQGLSWIDFSKSVLDKISNNKGNILFDLTNVSDLDNVLAGTGQFADKITSQELRYIKDNWDRFKDVVTFCKDGVEVAAPW